MARSRRPKPHSRKSDSVLNTVRALEGHIYVLDASSVLNDPDLPAYLGRHEDIVGPANFVVSSAMLSELDAVRHQSKADRVASHHKLFNELLRNLIKVGKLSHTVQITKDSTLTFVPRQVKLGGKPWWPWPRSSADYQLLDLAMQLSPDATILSADSLLQVIAGEAGVRYVFIPPIDIKAITTMKAYPFTTTQSGTVTVIEKTAEPD